MLALKYINDLIRNAVIIMIKMYDVCIQIFPEFILNLNFVFKYFFSVIMLTLKLKHLYWETVILFLSSNISSLFLSSLILTTNSYPLSYSDQEACGERAGVSHTEQEPTWMRPAGKTRGKPSGSFWKKQKKNTFKRARLRWTDTQRLWGN